MDGTLSDLDEPVLVPELAEQGVDVAGDFVVGERAGPDDVAATDDAHDAFFVVDDGEALESCSGHQLHDLGQVGLLVDCDGGAGHHLGDPRCGAAVAALLGKQVRSDVGDDRVADQVDLGDRAADASTSIDERERGHLPPGEQVNCGLDVGVSSDGRWFASHQLLDEHLLLRSLSVIEPCLRA